MREDPLSLDPYIGPFPRQETNVTVLLDSLVRIESNLESTTGVELSALAPQSLSPEFLEESRGCNSPALLRERHS